MNASASGAIVGAQEGTRTMMQCDGSPLSHFFPGLMGDPDGSERCLCGYTWDEASAIASEHVRAVRQHAEMGWP